MKIIKFRAWNKEEKIMVDLQKITPLALNDMMNTQLNLQGRSGLFIPFFKELELMQYTGLKDKNNKEIYEFDNLKYENLIGIVEYKNGSFVIDNIYLGHFDESDVEVIGNIYEHNFLLDSNS